MHYPPDYDVYTAYAQLGTAIWSHAKRWWHRAWGWIRWQCWYKHEARFEMDLYESMRRHAAGKRRMP